MKYQLRVINDGRVKIFSTHYNPDIAIEKNAEIDRIQRNNEGTVEIVEIFSKRQKKRNTSFIDLGLSSGTLWADRNVGADSPDGYGDYFRFGETTPYTEDSQPYVYDDITADNAGTDKDAATAILGEQFRMPTIIQIRELINECSREWTTIGGVNGTKVTGPNGNSVFFPAAGYRSFSDGFISGGGSYGCYWSASPSSSYYGHYLGLCSVDWTWYYSKRAYGFPVRAVKR